MIIISGLPKDCRTPGKWVLRRCQAGWIEGSLPTVTNHHLKEVGGKGYLCSDHATRVLPPGNHAMQGVFPVLVFAVIAALLLLSGQPAFGYPLSGGPHDRSSDPLFPSSGLAGVCNECHIPHYAPEVFQYTRDQSPDATNSSDLCLDCHSGTTPPWAATARDVSDVDGSRHDFSSRPSIGWGGVCWPCHNLHLPNETTVSYAGTDSGKYFRNFILWSRDISGGKFIISNLYQVRRPVSSKGYILG